MKDCFGIDGRGFNFKRAYLVLVFCSSIQEPNTRLRIVILSNRPQDNVMNSVECF